MTAPDRTRDLASTVRPGEELPMAPLLKWLSGQIPGLQDEPQVTQFSGGASNWTYRLAFANEDLVLRRPPAGTKAKSAHDMGREYRLQKALKPVYPLVPAMRAYCADETVIGAEFYVMERLCGIIPRQNLPRSTVLTTEQTRRLCTNVIDALIALHSVDHVAAGLSDLGAGAGYTQRQVEGWSRRYRDARTWNVAGGETVMAWLAANRPRDERICITHNDFRFDNVVLDADNPERVIGVLDWELATLGDPLVDLGNMLAYWVEPGDDFLARATRRQPTTLPGMLTRREVIDYYREKTGIEIGDTTFYEVFGLFRLAGITQQIYYRYHHGQTRNPAFKNFWIFVNYLLWRCHRLMRRQH